MIYNPTKNIVPWTSPVKEDNPLLKQWRKNVKPSLQDYKEFCEEKYYQLWLRKTVNTIEAHGLEHLIDPKHTPADKKYDKAQQKWLFKAFENVFLAGFAQSLIKKYQNTKDTQLVWKELTDHYDTSTFTTLYWQQLSACLASTK